MARCVASPVRGDLGDTPGLDHGQLLQQVLTQGGAQCIPTLRRWAQQKRQYRGEIFTEEEVEVAVAAFKAKSVSSQKRAKATQAAENGQQKTVDTKPEEGPNGLRVTLNCKLWPWPNMLDAAKLMSRARDGQCVEVTAETVKNLFEGARGARHPDVVLVAGYHQPVRIGAHKALLASFSDVLRAKFEGSFDDASDALLEVQCSPDVVRATLEFLYTGSCEVEVTLLGEVVVLADYWQAMTLADAAAKCWYKLPIVHQLEVLSSLDESSTVPRSMVGGLVESLSTSFTRAAGTFQSSGTSWQLLLEMHQWLSHTPSVSLERLKHWLALEEDDLYGAVQKFLRSALQAADRSSPEMRELLRRRSLKTWLPEQLLRSTVFDFIEREKAFDETGQVAFWVTFCHSGGFNCQTLVEIYEAIANTTMARVPLITPLESGPNVAPAVPEEQEHTITRHLQGLMHSFGVALAEQSYLSDESSFWAGTSGAPNAMLHSAAACFGSAALHGRPFPRLSSTVIHLALQEALSKAEVSAVSVLGPKATSGIYTRKGEKFQCQKDQETLELVYTERTGRENSNKLSIIWKGIPADEYRKAKGIWSIQKAGSDELTPPLALLLSRSVPWGPIRSQWWLSNSENRFCRESSLAVELDAISDAEASKLKKSLKTVQLKELLQVLGSTAARKLCETAMEDTKVEEVRRAGNVTRATSRREEDERDWKEAAKVFDVAAVQLCQILQELQGADASIRKRLLAKKRRIETEEQFVAAVRRLEEAKEAS